MSAREFLQLSLNISLYHSLQFKSSFLEVVNLKDIIIWLAPRCDWLPERTRWSHLDRSRLPAVSRKKNFSESHIINPLLTKFVRSRWLAWILVSFFFCEFMDRDFVSVYKHAKKELGQYPAILTSHSVNNPYFLN